MISQKMQDAINVQINAEMWSSNLYLSMSLYFSKEGYDGFAKWMKFQSQEELTHAYDMIDYMIKRDGVPSIGAIAAVPTQWQGPLDAFENTFKHECKVSEMINVVVGVASGEKDNATQDFFWKYVREQVEEEATARGIIDKIKMAGTAGIFFIDAQLGQRK